SRGIPTRWRVPRVGWRRRATGSRQSKRSISSRTPRASKHWPCSIASRSSRGRGPLPPLSHPRGHGAPHQIEGDGELAMDVDHGRRAPEPRIVALLAKDGLTMVEGVERLRQAERVLRQERQLERTDGGIHDFVESRRLEHEAPELVGGLAGVERLARGP